jgi:hypothetical protein
MEPNPSQASEDAVQQFFPLLITSKSADFISGVASSTFYGNYNNGL